MENLENKGKVEVGDLSDIRRRFPRQLVAIEITEEKPKIGCTRGLLIAVGSRSMEQQIMEELTEFRKANPDTRFGVFNTGRMRSPGSGLIY